MNPFAEIEVKPLFSRDGNVEAKIKIQAAIENCFPEILWGGRSGRTEIARLEVFSRDWTALSR